MKFKLNDIVYIKDKDEPNYGLCGIVREYFGNIDVYDVNFNNPKSSKIHYYSWKLMSATEWSYKQDFQKLLDNETEKE